LAIWFVASMRVSVRKELRARKRALIGSPGRQAIAAPSFKAPTRRRDSLLSAGRR